MVSARVSALANGIIGCGVGLPLLMAGLMCFDAAPDVKPSMALLGISSIIFIPCATLATAMTFISNDSKYQVVHCIAPCGIAIALLLDPLFQTPVEPNPPAPRSVGSPNSASCSTTDTTIGISAGAQI